MSRDWEGDGDNPAALLWYPTLERALRGKRGGKVLREMRDALLALPDQRLIEGEIVTKEGDVCAVGAYLRHKDPEQYKTWCERGGFNGDAYETMDLGMELGMQKTIAWELGALNDEGLRQQFVCDFFEAQGSACLLYDKRGHYRTVADFPPPPVETRPHGPDYSPIGYWGDPYGERPKDYGDYRGCITYNHTYIPVDPHERWKFVLAWVDQKLTEHHSVPA